MKNHYNKNPNIFAFDMFGLKCCLHPYISCQSCPRRHNLINYSQMIAYRWSIIQFLSIDFLNTMITIICIALRNHLRIVYQGMSSWTALTRYIGMKTAFQTKHIKIKYVRIFIIMIFHFHNIIRNAYLHWSSTKTQFYELLVVESCFSLCMHFLQSLFKFQIFRIEARKYLLFICTFGLKCCLHPYIPC